MDIIIAGLFCFCLLLALHFLVYAIARAVWRITESPEYPATQQKRRLGAVSVACLVLFVLRLCVAQHYTGNAGETQMFEPMLLLLPTVPEIGLFALRSRVSNPDPVAVACVIAVGSFCMGALMHTILRWQDQNQTKN